MAVDVGLDEGLEDVNAGVHLATLVGESDAGRAQDRSVIRRRRTRSVPVLRRSVVVVNPKDLHEERLLHEGELVAGVEAARRQDGLERRTVLVERLLLVAPGRVAEASDRHLAEKRQKLNNKTFVPIKMDINLFN